MYLLLLLLGHFLLLSSWASAEAPGRCEHHLTSPVLPGSDGRCILQVAVYESSPAVGNLSLLIKPVDSGSAGHSVDLHRRTPDNRRSTSSPSLFNTICAE